MNSPDLNIWAALPALSLSLGACVLFLIDAFIPKNRKTITAWLSVIGLLVSFVLTIPGFTQRSTAFNGMFIADPFTAVINLIALVTTFISILVAHDYLQRTHIERGEYYPLLLLTASGAMFMGSAGAPVSRVVRRGLPSIPRCLRSGVRPARTGSRETSLKTLCLGPFA